MPNSIITLFRHLTGSLLLLFLAVSCRQDESLLPSAPGKGATSEVTLSVRIPDFRAANTRAVDEKGIAEITVLMFADEGGTEKVKVKYDIPGSSLRTPSGSSDTRTFSVPVTASTYKRIALITNAQTELAGIAAGSTYDALKQVEVTGRFGQAGTGTYPAGGFELKAGVSQTIAQEIPLIRMLARVDIINPITSGATTAAGEVYFVNPVGNGRVWVDLATYNTTSTQSGYMTPTLPVAPQPAVGGGHPLEGIANTTSPNVITYYLNEQSATAGGSRPCIVMLLDYQGREFYYRMDYTWDGIKGSGAPPYEKGKYMPILRNHRYIFTIKEVKGPGVDTMQEAITSPENFTNRNIVVTPIVIDEEFADIAFNESGHFLAVTRAEMMLFGKHGAASTENQFSVRTSYPGGWNIVAYNSNGAELTASNSWLRTSAAFGAANSTAAVQALTNGIGFRRGYLEVRAGRLYTKVRVTQGGTPLDYVAEYNLAGGSIYGTSFSSSNPPGLSPIAAQTDVNLRWAANHNNNQSGYYNYFVCNSDNAISPPGYKEALRRSFFYHRRG